MKVIISGSRMINDYKEVEQAIKDSGFEITLVISGTARGVDKLGEQWAARNGIPVKLMPPKWAYFGGAAGVLRNKEMAKIADALIAVWDGKSPGTKNMREEAMRRKIKIFTRFVKE